MDDTFLTVGLIIVAIILFLIGAFYIGIYLFAWGGAIIYLFITPKIKAKLVSLTESGDISEITKILIKHQVVDEIKELCLNSICCYGIDGIDSAINDVKQKGDRELQRELESKRFELKRSQDESINLAKKNENELPTDSQDSSIDMANQLKALRLRFLELKKEYPNNSAVVGFGSEVDQNFFNIICDNCNDAMRALKNGVGGDGLPINKKQISNGLKRLVADAKNDIGIIALSLNPEGVQLYQKYLDQLNEIAENVG